MTSQNPEVRELREKVARLEREVKRLTSIVDQYGQNGLNHGRFESLDSRYAAADHTH